MNDVTVSADRHELLRIASLAVAGLRRDWVTACEAVARRESELSPNAHRADEARLWLCSERNAAGRRLARAEELRRELQSEEGDCVPASRLEQIARLLGEGPGRLVTDRR